MNNITPVVKNLLIINVLFFAATWVFKAQGIDLNGILGAHYFDSPEFRIWQPLTYMFMHGGLQHIAFNMFGLYMFGSILESHYGAKKFINFYLITGLGAIFLQWVVQAIELYQVTGAITVDITQSFPQSSIPTIESIYFGTMVGASGAIFGVMTAFAILYPNIELMLIFFPFPVKAKYFVPIYIVIELFLGVYRIEGDSVAHFAHLGGALIGYILVKLWRRKGNYYDYYE
jgi:membrane associated rhomboid family serine protease